MTRAHNTVEPGYRVTRKISGQYELQLWGKMPIGWVGNLTGGMAGTGISIERGAVQKVAGATWQADFEMKPMARDAEPEKIDFMRLARQASHATTTADFSLHEFTIREGAGNNDPLYLEVTAADQKGFLGALLSRLAFFSLFPEEMSIETSKEMIYDRFWLKSPGGQRPSAEVANVLRRSLAGRVTC